MVSAEAQRTLVKSAPELWAEVSDPDSLARHLAELGEIRITRVEPESEVHWEAGSTSGSVLIKPSGWGTRVLLSVTQELDELARALEAPPEIEPAAPELEAPAEPPPAAIAEPEPAAIAEPVPAAIAEPVPAAVPEPAFPVEELLPPSAPTAAEPLPQPVRPGFLARMFGRFRGAGAAESSFDTSATPSPPAEAVPAPPQAPPAPEPPAPAIDALQARFIVAEQPRSQSPAEAVAVPDAEAPAPAVAAEAIAAPPQPQRSEHAASEEAAREKLTALLTAMLDRLGAAHHRPFSRA